MTTKQAKKIVNTMKQGLTGNDLAAAIAAATSQAGIKDASDPNFEKVAAEIRNEYVQHAWDTKDDLIGEPAAKPDKFVETLKKGKKENDARKKKAAKKVTPKKVAAAKKAKDKRLGKDGKVIVAYPQPQGRTATMFAAVLAGASNAEGLEVIKKEFGKCPTTISSIGWVRSQLRNNAAKWNGKYNATSKLIKSVKSDKECGKMNRKLFAELNVVESEDESEE